MIVKKGEERVNKCVWWQTGEGKDEEEVQNEREEEKRLNESKEMDSEKLGHQHKCVQRIFIIIS